MGEEDWRIGEVDCWRTMVQGEVRGLGIGEVSALLIGLVPMEKDLTRGGGGGAATDGPLLGQRRHLRQS